MTEKCIVLVLEDMDFRVEYLERMLEGTPGEVRWVKTVQEFRKELETTKPVLIFLDHDLGEFSLSSEDVNGECGRDAAKAIPAKYDVPVVIWSINEDGGKAMLKELTSKGVPCKRIPFLKENLFAIAKMAAYAVSP